MARLPSGFPRPPKRIQQRQLNCGHGCGRASIRPTSSNRLTHDGFSTIPSTMPLIMSVQDDLSKGSPVSSTYLDLWTRAYDEGFVTLSKPREMAFHAGFSTQRAERTWRQKLDNLASLGFIDLKSGPSGPASYALIWNPYLVIKDHHDRKTQVFARTSTTPSSPEPWRSATRHSRRPLPSLRFRPASRRSSCPPPPLRGLIRPRRQHGAESTGA